MTNYQTLYREIPARLNALPEGPFRLSDICDNPPAGLGRIFRNDVIAGKFSGIRRIDADERSVIYEKTV